MIAVSKSVGATLSNGALSLWVQSADGDLLDVFAASFQILDAAGSTVLAKTALNVGAATPSGSHAGIGHYVAPWAPGSAAVGKYTVRWFYTVTASSIEQSFDQEFELVAVPYSGPHYCSVYDLVDEGLPSTVTAAQAQTMIVRASRYVEHFTGRRFDPSYKTILVDGNNGRALQLDEPIVAIENILITVTTPFGSKNLSLLIDTIRIFNRHIRDGLASPDDRDNPKLEFVHGDDLGGVNYDPDRSSSYVLDTLIWPRGRQNVQITGLFGYTESDGSFTGGTPQLIREAAKLMVFRNLDKIVNRSGRPDSSRIVQEQTRDQSVMYAQPIKGSMTGDWEIDSILTGFVRPPIFGSA